MPMERSTADSPQARISRNVVGVFKQMTGRGPSQARTYITDDVVSVVLRDVLTDLERGLIGRDGTTAEHEIQHLRWEVQQAMREDLVAVVETELGRKVSAFMSANHIDPDLALETFVLAPVNH